MSGELDGSLLKVFVAIIECQGFSAAAERLHKTQSTVSQSLQRLEEIVGTPLIHRTSRTIGLTPSGETFLIYARQILKLHLEAVNAVQLPNEQVCIHVGMPEDYAQYCLGGMLKDFQAQFAQVRPDICCEMSTALVSRLHRGELDLVLGVEHAGLQPGEYLCDEPLVWVAAPSWSGVGRQSVPLAVYAEGCAFRANAVQALAQAGRSWQVVYTSQSPRGIAIAIEQGLSVGVMARRLVPQGWQILDEQQGFPPIAPARLMFWRSAGCQVPEVDALVEILQRQLGRSGYLHSQRVQGLTMSHALEQ
ncbi:MULTISPECIES: LysR family transcriptional regulator [Pseudomonas]|uniref:LysR family transcriptional regulator n=1 Tax=Pseudomonas fluorescens ICMP 11288 TaxID=1198309 RepID=A0A0W0I2H9_PSEFL|nr:MULTISPECIES: LysR family transcriptional regulator [Pseudomonas]KTB67327.1 LysR family transcriptional regulator [Pseudomonas fluorescens ICMP 11288]